MRQKKKNAHTDLLACCLLCSCLCTHSPQTVMIKVLKYTYLKNIARFFSITQVLPRRVRMMRVFEFDARLPKKKTNDDMRDYVPFVTKRERCRGPQIIFLVTFLLLALFCTGRVFVMAIFFVSCVCVVNNKT